MPDAGDTAPTADAARTRLMEASLGYQLSQAIRVAVALGIADLLASGPRSNADLAAATGAHPATLYRLMRALAAAGIFHEDGEHSFSLGPLGQHLRSDIAGSFAPFVAMMTGASVWQAWGDLLHAVRTGDTAFEHTHGTDVWAYRTAHVEEGKAFDLAMAARTEQLLAAALGAYDFGRFAHIVDIGGGDGTLLARILATHPHARGTLLDQPQTVARARASLAALGLSARCEAVAGSFFETVPGAGDAYILKYILHDWDDEACLAILRACRRAMRPAARLVVIERVIGPPNAGAAGKLMDLHMLAVTGGRERTAEEFRTLFLAAGFDLVSVTPTATAVSVIEGAPVA